MKKKQLIILKLGGSAITLKEENKPEINAGNLRRLSHEIAEAKKEKKFSLVIVHGAGPFGHIPAKKYRLNDGLKNRKQIRGITLTHQSMEKLNYAVVSALQNAGINAIAYQPSAAGILRNRKIKKFNIEGIKRLLSLNIVPVAYGDVLADEKLGCSILSGDHLAPYLAKKLNADRIILAADVPGIFDCDPKRHANAKLIKEVTLKNIHKISGVGSSMAVDVTGGMKRKLSELISLAKTGIESEIVDGTKPGILKKALKGEKGLGTTIKK